jgi:hypothetical protein
MITQTSTHTTAPASAPRLASSLPHAPQLQTQIIATIGYFDMFDRPLTAFEVFTNLLSKDAIAEAPMAPGVAHGAGNRGETFTEYNNILTELRNLVRAKRLAYREGLYALPNRLDIVEERHMRHIISKPKWDRAVFAAKLIRHIPFVRMVAVCNTLSFNAAKETSDIDLLIVVEKGRIWLSRLLITGLIQAFGIRRHGKHIASRICLSFYVTNDNLNLSNIWLDPFDIYLIYYTTQVVVLYDNNDTRRAFIRENQWVNQYLERYQPYEVSPQRTVRDTAFSRFVRGLGEKLTSGAIGNRIEHTFGKMQQQRMRKRKTLMPKPHRRHVVINNTMLKFHERDRRHDFYKRWRTNVRG